MFVGLLGSDLLPELDFEWSSKCLFNHSLVVEVEREEDGLGDIEAHEVECPHVSGLNCVHSSAFLELILLKGNELGLIRLAQEFELKIQQ